MVQLGLWSCKGLHSSEFQSSCWSLQLRVTAVLVFSRKSVSRRSDQWNAARLLQSSLLCRYVGHKHSLTLTLRQLGTNKKAALPVSYRQKACLANAGLLGTLYESGRWLKSCNPWEDVVLDKAGSAACSFLWKISGRCFGKQRELLLGLCCLPCACLTLFLSASVTSLHCQLLQGCCLKEMGHKNFVKVLVGSGKSNKSIRTGYSCPQVRQQPTLVVRKVSVFSDCCLILQPTSSSEDFCKIQAVLVPLLFLL